MLGEFGQMRQFEREYEARMPREVRELKDLRDVGKETIRLSGGTASRIGEGLTQLRQSTDGLHEVARDAYQREYYASLYMYARGLSVAGSIKEASEVAIQAMEVEPQIRTDIGLPRDLIADQYVAIASATLSAVMQAGIKSVEPVTLQISPDARLARRAASRALQTCLWSEDRTRMLFANGDQSELWRSDVRKAQTKKAAIATGMLLIPAQSNRIKIARRLCKM